MKLQNLLIVVGLFAFPACSVDVNNITSLNSTAADFNTSLPNSTLISKVVVPAVYHEWVGRGPPSWVWNETFQAEYGFTTFLYQKLNSSEPNYVATNRGCENGVYYQYIVDHYDNFPDLAFFVHAHPHEHNDYWLNLVRCARPNATYSSLNLNHFTCRESWNGIWARYGIWLEQCIRDTLRIAWGNISVAELNQRLPPNRSIRMCTHCCQQFLLSREMVHRRTLQAWKDLQYVLSIQNVCHAGDPDYENLYSFNASSRMELGPEDTNLGMGGGKYGSSPGRLTQAVTSEHLAHVIFGQKPVEMTEPTMTEICDTFYPASVCPGSPCTGR